MRPSILAVSVIGYKSRCRQGSGLSSHCSRRRSASRSRASRADRRSGTDRDHVFVIGQALTSWCSRDCRRACRFRSCRHSQHSHLLVLRRCREVPLWLYGIGAFPEDKGICSSRSTALLLFEIVTAVVMTTVCANTSKYRAGLIFFLPSKTR